MSELDGMREAIVRVDIREIATGKIGIITLNRPESRNALNAELSAALPAAVSQCDLEPNMRAIVLTGADPAFCAGFDLRDVSGGEKKVRTRIPDIGALSHRRKFQLLAQSMEQQSLAGSRLRWPAIS